MLKRELYLNQIRPFMKIDLIKIIIGIRRSGKSTLLKQIIAKLKESGVKDSQIIYLNFEDYQIREYKDTDRLYNYLEKKVIDGVKTYIFLDEIQEVENFEQVVNSFNATKDVDIYLTGSNSKMLSGEYATLITGRYKIFEIFPFSFKELLEYHSYKDKKKLFNLFVRFGGFPVIQRFDLEDQKISILRDYLTQLLSKILFEDIMYLV